MPFEDLIFRAVKEQARQEGRLEELEAKIKAASEEGFKEAVEEGCRRTVSNQLRLRFGPLPHDVEQRLARADPEEIAVWVDRVLYAATLEDVIGAG